MSGEEKFPSDLADRFQVRMPPGLRDRIAEAAKANNRSMNAEIIARLERSFAVSYGAEDVDARFVKLTETLRGEISKLLDDLKK